MRHPGYNMAAGREQASLLMERENNGQIETLHAQVSTMRTMSVEIGDEVHDQNKQLDELGDAMDKSAGMMAGTMKRLDGVVQNAGGQSQFYALIGFVVAAFVFCYYIAEHRGTDGT